MSDDILAGLNDAQLRAVTAPDGPVLVLAGPGSGKTRVLTHRIAWLIREQDIAPWRIMAVTFTNKAAKEMQRRVAGLLGGRLRGLTVGTFHATCARILRREADCTPLTQDYVIYDTTDQQNLVKEIITDVLKLDPKRYPPGRILGMISKAKNSLITPEVYQADSYMGEIAQRAYTRYMERLVENNAMDFDDLLLRTALLFQEHPDVLQRYQQSYDHLLVDEFQDTNSIQYTLVHDLADAHHNLFCVGDEDQSIYRWRGADYRNVLRLREDYPEMETILLEENYRSTQVILDAAQAVINQNRHRTPKQLFTRQEGGPEIVLYETHDEQYEAQFVVDTIATLVATEGIDPGECAVMYRTNAQSRVIEDAFVRAGLPYRLVGATRFYSRREIKDVLGYLRLIHNLDDGVSLTRVINVPSRGIGKKTVGTLFSWARGEGLSPGVALGRLAADPDSGPFSGRARSALGDFAATLSGWREARQTLSVADLLKRVLDDTGYETYINDRTDQGEERWANVLELMNVAAEYEELPLSTFLEEVSLVSDVDNLAEDGGAPTLLTLHSAKGLEFTVVFLVGLEDGLLPHSRSRDDPEAMAEERRLLYVGMTRARRHLFLTHAFRRSVWGGVELGVSSRFLEDIPDHLLTGNRVVGATRSGVPERAAYRRATTWGADAYDASGAEYRSGQTVFHSKFGEGIIIQSKASGGDYELTVVFDQVGLKRLLASMANLEIVDD